MTNADMTSPVDLPPPEGEEQHPLLWTSIAIAVATGFLLLFNASALRGWAFDLEPNPQNERVVAVADGWYQRTEAFRLDEPVAAMSGWWNAVKALEFGSDEAAAPVADEPEAAAADAAGSDAGTDDAEETPAQDDSEGPGFSP
jgi:hypothetical protein